MVPVKKVALLGKGLLGSAILDQLVKSGFKVTVLSRKKSSSDESSADFSTVQVDYSSIDSLAAALQDHDAVVSTVGISGISGQKIMIDASIQAGVRRFIPSDFGALTTRPGAESLPLNAPWIDVQAYLKEKALSRDIEYTLFAVGPFLEFVMSMPFLADVMTQEVRLYDNGEHSFSSTSVLSIGKAVAGSLRNAEATKNRLVSVHDIVLTQNKVLDLAKRYSAPDVNWNITPVNAEAEVENILERIRTSGLDLLNTLALLKAALLGGKFEAEFKNLDNELVGLSTLSDDEFEKKFAVEFKSMATAMAEFQAKNDGTQGEA
ncbi:uncharacterized protein N7529_000609 [Penicillium soppii]|uniref:uncharacterized protein n=1 Tax=Penicillium soppii TaxID=69789 RepID=UPI002547230A|nr:uncharacterized protein N7529_000609 [Penicillium soppii]KAJ5881937.1 hypothetical protein N7529_000609 [Penicillium soppii]